MLKSKSISFASLPLILKEKTFITFVTITLICSPSISLFKALTGGFYFPNEKLLLLILFLWGVKSEGLAFIKKKALLPFLFISTIFSGFIVLRAIFWETNHLRDLNIAITIYSVGLIYNFLKERKEVLKPALKWSLVLQTGIGIFQYLNVYLGNRELAMLFHNHPMQEGYYFYWRVSGLFMESSQYASFLVLGLFVLVKKEFLNIFEYILLIFAFLVFITNKALTGYLIFLIWMLIDNRKTRGALLVGFLLLVFDFFVTGFSEAFIMATYKKVYITFFDFSKIAGEVRFYNAINAIKAWASGIRPFIFGIESREIDQIGDIFSYNLYRFGIVGFLLILAFYCQFITSLSKKWLLILPLFLTCGPISQPIQIIYLVSLKLGAEAKNNSL